MNQPDPAAGHETADVKQEQYRFWDTLALALHEHRPLHEAVLAAMQQVKNQSLREIAVDVARDLENGVDLLDALRKHPRFFSKGVVGLIKAGIENNKLAEMAANAAKGLAAVAFHAQAQEKIAQEERGRQEIITSGESYKDRTARTEKLVRRILEDAIGHRATYIHIEPRRMGAQVRFRIDGLLHNALPLNESDASSVFYHLKSMSNILTAAGYYPQRGRMFLIHEGRQVDFSLTVLPFYHGEKVLLKLFDRSARVLAPDQLGLRGGDLQTLRSWMDSRAGMALYAGPTGSGKSTTMFSLLQHIDADSQQICTIEQDFQFLLPGVNAMRVKPAEKLDYANLIAMQIRQDPDVVAVDEIHTGNVAALLADAVRQGPLAVGTLDAQGAPEAMYRLLSWELDPFVIADVVLGVCAQCLVRINCKSCRREVKVTSEQAAALKHFGFSAPRRAVAGKGCKQCDGGGYQGVTGVFEVLPISPGVLRALEARKGARAVRRAAVDAGMSPMAQHGWKKAKAGEISIAEFLRALRGSWSRK